MTLSPFSPKPGGAKVKARIRDFDNESKKYQKLLDEVLIDRTSDSFLHDDENFPFRYASGGTLPILRMEGQDYYCFFYRDIFPIGWNIANGGCCTREELLNPQMTIERELREELVIVNKYQKIQYAFGGDDAALSFRPHRLEANKAYRGILPGLAIGGYQRVQARIKWIDGPDCLSVRIDNDDFEETTACFLNINAEDFGIELDKVAKIAVSGKVSICDGEQTRNFLLHCLPRQNHCKHGLRTDPIAKSL